MKYLLITELDCEVGKVEKTKVFNASSDASALIKAFGDIDKIPNEVMNDPEFWFGMNTEAKMYNYGAFPPPVQLFRLGEEVAEANNYMLNVHKFIQEKLLEKNKSLKEKMEFNEMHRLAKKFGKQIV